MNPIISRLKQFWNDKKGLALVEGALLLPVIITLSFGIHDLGTAIALNQKVVAAAQISADLIGRERSVTTDELEQALAAAELALDPYDKSGLGFDVVGVKFNSSLAPIECWRHTSGDITPHNPSASETAGLGDENEGLIVLTTKYEYKPYFSGDLLGTFDIEERAYIRGRKNAIIPMEDF